MIAKKESYECSYYGCLDGKRYGDPVGVFVVDEAFQRLLDRYEEKLTVNQAKLVESLKSTFSQEIKDFTKKLDALDKRLVVIEKQKSKSKVKGDKENAQPN